MANTRPNDVKTVKVQPDPSSSEKEITIGADLDPAIREELITFLKENMNTFAWTPQDMKGIDRRIATHELKVDRTYKPIKQKRRKLGPDKAQAVKEEVEKLLKLGSIHEVKYPEWLANPVVVRKKNGKWRVCVDFTDLNQACPKDSYPLPRIDKIVESTSGNQLLSFMDAFSGYNQIFMHPMMRRKHRLSPSRGHIATEQCRLD